MQRHKRSLLFFKKYLPFGFYVFISYYFALQALSGLSVQFAWAFFPNEFIKKNPIIFLLILPLLFSAIITFIKVRITNEFKIGLFSKEPIKLKQGKNYLFQIGLNSGDYREIHLGEDIFKIKIIDIKKHIYKIPLFFSEEELYGALVDIDLGGRVTFGGICAKDEGVNKYLLPEAKYAGMHLHDISVYFVYIEPSHHLIFNLYIENINPEKKEITVNVFISSSSKIISSL
jgi:hypothetical protein